MRMLLLTAILALAGCVTAPPVPQSRAEWAAVHTRTFADRSPEQVQEAAERVLRAADDEFGFDYPPGELVATRPWLIYAVLAATSGKDYWKLETEEVDGGTRATVQISRTVNTILPMPTAAGDMSVSSSNMPGSPIRWGAVYDLFWQRVEQQLGLREDWPTCDEYLANFEGSKAGLDTLCAVHTDDKVPEGAIP